MGFNIGADGRILAASDQTHAKGQIYVYHADPVDYAAHASKWFVPIAGGYTTPWVPALVKGRLYLRLVDRLACYDLRKSTTALGPKTARELADRLPTLPPVAAGYTAARLANVAPEAVPIRDAAFVDCLASESEHLLAIGIEQALAGESHPGTVIKGLERAAGNGNAERFQTILAAVPVSHPATATIAAAAADMVIMRPAFLTNAELVAALPRFGDTLRKLVPAWRQGLTDAMQRGDLARANAFLAVAPMDHENIPAAEFLALAKKSIQSGAPETVAGAVALLRRYGVSNLTPEQRDGWRASLMQLLEGKPSRHKLPAVEAIAEFGASAREAIPILRKVYLEDGMMDACAAAIKAIDPDAPVVKVDLDTGVGEETAIDLFDF
jgi:hypothetical protein